MILFALQCQTERTIEAVGSYNLLYVATCDISKLEMLHRSHFAEINHLTL